MYKASAFFYVCAGLALLSIPLPAGAADPTPLAPGTTVRLRAQPAGSLSVSGSVVRMGDGRLVLSTEATEREFLLGDLLRLDANIGNRSRAGRWAMVGGLAGMGIGLVPGSTIHYQGDWLLDPGNHDRAADGAFVGLLIGSVTGVLVGATQRAWKRVPLDGAVGFRTGESSAMPAVRLTIAW